MRIDRLAVAALVAGATLLGSSAAGVSGLATTTAKATPAIELHHGGGHGHGGDGHED